MSSAAPVVSTITWDELKLLLRAAQNPRFCGSVADAEAFFAGKRAGDSNAMIAAFPYIVYEALPKAHDVTPAQRTLLGNPTSINVAVDVALDEYIHKLSGKDWEAVERELEKLIAPTPADRAKICATFSKHLEAALINGIAFNQSKDLTLGMVGPRDMKCEDYPNYPLGKTASITLDPKTDVFHPQWFKSPTYNGHPTIQERAELVKELIGAMVAFAKEIIKEHK